MHSTLFSHIQSNLIEAETFVLRHMPLDLTTDQIYEDLIGNPDMAQAFANAAQFLSPQLLSRTVVVDTEEWGPMNMAVKLGPTDKYPLFFIPKTTLYLTRQSNLSRALQLPMRVGRDWRMLNYSFRLFNEMVDDAKIMAFLFPWIRELIADYANDHQSVLFVRSKARIGVDKEVKDILDGRTPRNFPRMTEQLNEVCRSGKALFAQYRMLESSHASAPISPVIPQTSAVMPDWLVTHMTEVLDDWRQECIEQRLNMRAEQINRRRRR